MARRFNNKNLSTPYIESLKQVKNIQFMSGEKRADDHRRDRDELDSDRLFLEDFVKLYTGHPGLLNTPIPNLMNMVNHLPPSGSFELYNNETCTEFHHLLLELLDRFKEALDSLIALDRVKTANLSDQAVKKFNQHVSDVHRNGYGLLRLSRGRAFQRYLENIKTLLKDPRGGSNVGASIRQHEGDIEGDIDEELEEIQSFLSQKGSDGADTALLKSYTAWLRLMVGHFDAVKILVRYVTSQHFLYDSISIEILLPPPTDSALLPWSQLFANFKFLPKSTSQPAVNNNEIFNFLQDGISNAIKVRDAVLQAQNALKCWKAQNHVKTRQAINLLKISTDKDVKEMATDLYPKISKPNSLSDEDRIDITNKIQKLCTVLGELSDKDRFFLSLNSLSFKGTIHCEACLATLLPAFTGGIPTGDSKYKEIKILPNMQVEYPLSHLFLLFIF
jgi:hypothetical protein